MRVPAIKLIAMDARCRNLRRVSVPLIKPSKTVASRKRIGGVVRPMPEGRRGELCLRNRTETGLGSQMTEGAAGAFKRSGQSHLGSTNKKQSSGLYDKALIVRKTELRERKTIERRAR